MGCESRVYLSKSNLADKQHLHQVRVYLMELGYEIVEWHPESDGPYTEHPMLECDQMVIVGYDLNEDDIMEVGKGQFNQLQFRENNGLYANCYFVGFNSDTPEFYSCELMDVKDENSWKQGYGELQLVDDFYFNEIAPTKKERPKPTETVDEVYAKNASPARMHLACITLLR